MNARQWPWYFIQIAIVMGTVWIVTVTGGRQDLATFAVILGVCLASLFAGISFRISDWRVRRAARQVHQPQSDSLSLPRTGRHFGDSAKLIGSSRVRQNIR